MSDFLKAMARERAERVRRDAASGPPLTALRAEAEERRGDRRPFEQAIRRREGEPVRLIAEAKRASPSAGALVRAYDPAALAREYAASGAAALSILTEPAKFLGSIAHLRSAREATSLPVLLKDFIVHERQIYEAGAAGADAALLIVAALDPAQLRDYAALLVDLAICPLVEIHDVKEVDAALSVPGVLGVNNRDLTTLEVRAGHAERVLPLLPSERARVAESGYANESQVLAAERAGADAILVGEALLRAGSVASAFQALLGARAPVPKAGPA